MARRKASSRPSPLDAARIRAVLALDVERDDELIRERALEIAAECAAGDPHRGVPELDAEAWRLVDAFEGHVPPPQAAFPARIRSAAAVAIQCRELVARIDASRRGA